MVEGLRRDVEWEVVMRAMPRWALVVLALGLTLGLSLAAPGAARAQTAVSAELQNSDILIDYIEPRNPRYQPMLERLQQQQFLERLQQFLSPLRLPKKLRIRLRQCNGNGAPDAFYSPIEWAVNICYELIDFIEQTAPKADTAEFKARRVVAGAIIGAVMHEIGHALFDILQVPVIGREEDAADQMASFLALQLDEEVALTVVQGFAYLHLQFGELSGGQPSDRRMFADEHGTSEQRFFNLLCIAYGGKPQIFGGFARPELLPPARATGCRDEYLQVENAFARTIYPHIDQGMMLKVQSVRWLAE